MSAAAWVFGDVLSGQYRFVGHSDRWNTYLNYAQYFALNLAHGFFSAWADRVFGGFNVIEQVSGTPSPLFLLPALSPNHDVVGVFGYVAFATLAFTLIETYWVIQRLWTPDRLAATAGACVYACATFSLVKQADGSSTLVPLFPLLFFLVHTADTRRPVRTFVRLGGALAIGLWFGFVQEMSYVLLFLVAYAGYLWLRGNGRPLISLLASGAGAAMLVVPRLIGLAHQIESTGRINLSPASELHLDFPWILHNFDRGIFGSGGAAGYSAGYGFNPFDTDPLFASEFASMLALVAMVLALVAALRRDSGWWRPAGAEWLPLAWLVVIELILHNRLAYRLLQLLYANVSFEHIRISFSATLPLALVCATALARPALAKGSVVLVAEVAAGLAASVAATVYDFAGWRAPVLAVFGQPDQRLLFCSFCPGGQVAVVASEAIRLSVLGAIYAVILLGGWRIPTFGRYGAQTTLALAVVFQAIWGAGFWLSGPQTKSFSMPWEHFDLVMARADQFQPPSDRQVAELRSLLDDEQYRSVVICPDTLIVPDCGNGVAFNWQIRLAEGYGSFVPRDYLDLMGGSLHGMRFGTAQGLPWKMLSLLNVRNAIVLTPAFFMNQDFDPVRDLQVVRNPSPYVYPRAYFAREVRSASEQEAAAALRAEFGGLRPPDDLPAGPRPFDYVQGPALAGPLDASGAVGWSGEGDQLTLSFPASRSARFLVVNERYDTGWHAFIDGQETAMYPANVFMRGIPLPPGVSSVTLEYKSFLHFTWRYWLALAVLTAGLAAALRWRPGVNSYLIRAMGSK